MQSNQHQRYRGGLTADSKKRFGVFEFDRQARELNKHGVRLKVQEQPLQILEALLEQAGQIVPREDVQRRLWPDGTFVDYEQSLNKAVNKLREALGDSADHPIYIETLTRRGYRFVAPVDHDQPVHCDLPVPPPVPVAVPRRRVPSFLTAVGLVLAAVMLGTGLWPIGVPQVQRVVPLTNDITNKLVPLFSDGSRVFYSDLRDIRSVPTSGGSPRKQLTLAFLADERNTTLAGYSPTRQQMLLRSRGPGRAIWMWLVGQEGETLARSARLSPNPSPSLQTLSGLQSACRMASTSNPSRTAKENSRDEFDVAAFGAVNDLCVTDDVYER